MQSGETNTNTFQPPKAKTTGEPCGRCTSLGRLCPAHEGTKHDETYGTLSASQVKALEALVSQGIDETLEAVAARGGVSRVTLWRYLQDPEFIAAYRQRVEDEMGSQRARVARALIEGACTPGQGQASMQRIYWQRLGELSEKREISGPDGGPVETRETFDWSVLSTKTLRQIDRELESAGQEQ